jgi:hypothetical protein
MTASALESTPPPRPATLTNRSVAIREHLMAALRADLIGPFAPPDSSGADDARELLPQKPTRWYLTGFLSPETARESAVDPTSEEDPQAGDDKPVQDANEADPGPKVKHRWPASLGLSVLLPPGSITETVGVTVRYAEYRPVAPANDASEADAEPTAASEGLAGWERVPQPPRRCALAIDPERIRRGVEVPGAPGLELVGKLGVASGRGLPEGTRALSLFLVNRRRPEDPKRPDEQCIFQVELQLDFAGGFLARPNRKGEGSKDWDENVSDLQFRGRCEYAVGHGVAVEVVPSGADGGNGRDATSAPSTDGAGVTSTACDDRSDDTALPRVTAVRTTWLPRASVRSVKTREAVGVSGQPDARVETRMEALAALDSEVAVHAALDALPAAYGEWISAQRASGGSLEPERADTLDALLDDAETARSRIEHGIALVATDPEARRAFQLANRAMAVAAERRSPGAYSASERPRWRLFQIAFLLLNVPGLVDPRDRYRDTVELIFFPTGGGKTEAYLGVIAFALVLRRLRGRGRPDAGLGVAVLLRYTLRLLTLDQLARASTLVCALERLRLQSGAESLAELGGERFAIGLWVGRSATANTMKAVAREIGRYQNDSSPGAVSPFPLTHCPWCRSEHLRAGARPFELKRYPDNRRTDPERVIVSCSNVRCEFNEGRQSSAREKAEGLPVLFVDEQIYRELPSFVLATVDKFAMLPWRGETGLFFGRASALHDGKFYGPLAAAPRGALKLPEGLRPPELIVQDELHLISGPLGTMVGLYETAIDALCSRPAPGGGAEQRPLRPKILAATATVRRSEVQVRALFARERRLFPPPGRDEAETFFAEVDRERPPREYVGVAAPGRAMKVMLLRVYVSLMAAAQRCVDTAGPPDQAADGYLTLAGYFNSLRELGGMRRLVEDYVRARVAQAEERRPRDFTGPHPWYQNRTRWVLPVELTSREKTETIKSSKARLATPHAAADNPVDVLLASNMISVGVDIDRLGLMVVAGQPKTTSEYIQASSRVGRHENYPGLVVACFNLIRPRDRSHYERFTAYHESFYRHVEATSVTPFSGPALDRGLAGTLVALARLSEPGLTAPKAAMDFGRFRGSVGEAVVAALVARASEQPQPEAAAAGAERDAFGEQVRQRARKLLDWWEEVIAQAREASAERTYSGYDLGGSWTTAFLHPPIERTRPDPRSPEAHFVAPTSLRDVEPSVPLWLPSPDGSRNGDHS